MLVPVLRQRKERGFSSPDEAYPAGLVQGASSLSDLSSPAVENGAPAQISLRSRHLCSHKLLELMKILSRIPLPSHKCSKSDRLLAPTKPIRYRFASATARWAVFWRKAAWSGSIPGGT